MAQLYSSTIFGSLSTGTLTVGGKIKKGSDSACIRAKTVIASNPDYGGTSFAISQGGSWLLRIDEAYSTSGSYTDMIKIELILNRTVRATYYARGWAVLSFNSKYYYNGLPTGTATIKGTTASSTASNPGTIYYATRDDITSVRISTTSGIGVNAYRFLYDTGMAV